MCNKELIVGATDRLSFGSGKEVMPYINADEVNYAWDLGLTEFGNMGHIVPGHKPILDMVSCTEQPRRPHQGHSHYILVITVLAQYAILPCYIPSQGVSGMLKKLNTKKNSCKPGIDDEKLLFYQSAIYAYEVF